MGKKTDYKRLWRNAKEGNITMANRILRLEGIIEGQVETLERIRDGKIKPEDVIARRRVKPSADLQAVIDQAREGNRNG